MTSVPDISSVDLASRLNTNALVMRVRGTERLSSSLIEVRLAGAAALAGGEPGHDVMIRLRDAQGRYVRRRYSVRDVDVDRDELTLWVGTDHDGPGVQWATTVRVGDDVDVVGPRGKITLNPLADWHLFVGDVSALGAFYRLAQSVEPPGRCVFIVEIDYPDDAVTASFDEGIGVTGIFVDRRGRALDDPTGLTSGLASFALPPGEGHAYLFGEYHVLRHVRLALIDRGLRDEQISTKAFWRAGRRNADHGEPDKD